MRTTRLRLPWWQPDRGRVRWRGRRRRCRRRHRAGGGDGDDGIRRCRGSDLDDHRRPPGRRADRRPRHVCRASRIAGCYEEVTGAGSGSGFIIDPEGIAVTNNHVVTGAAALEVFVDGSDAPVNAVLGVSECADLAVIDLDGGDYPFLDWYDGEIEPGLEVRAAGFPLGDPEYTLTQGIVSKADADGESSWASVDSVIEHDASIQPGNSGGRCSTPSRRGSSPSTTRPAIRAPGRTSSSPSPPTRRSRSSSSSAKGSTCTRSGSTARRSSTKPTESRACGRVRLLWQPGRRAGPDRR